MAIDATIAGEDSNSYVTIAEADTYASERGHSGWEDLDDDEKSAALINAAEFLDDQYGKKFSGERATADQYLEFPRIKMKGIPDKKDENGNYVLEIPKKVKYAQIELALAYLENDKDFYAGLSESGVKSYTNTVGPLMEQKEFFESATGYEMYTSRVNKLLANFIGGTTFVTRV